MRTLSLFLLLCVLGLTAAAQFPEIPPSVLPAAKNVFDDGQDPMRSRLFRTTTARTQIDLGGWWDFVTDPSDTGEAKGYPATFPDPETRLWVPGTWNALAAFWHYSGPAWYRREFETAADGNLRLRFGGVFYRSAIWLDGQRLGGHEGGYLPFAFAAPDLKKGRHVLVVRVDNRLGDTTLPKRNVDWFPYGGIDRPVYAEMVAPVYVERFHVIPESIRVESAQLKVRVELRNLGPNEESVTLAFSADGGKPSTHRHTAGRGASTAEWIVPLERPRFWSPGRPNLYSARVAVNGASDDQFTRFGVREVRVAGTSILLNGARIKVMGANRHEDHPDWGSGSPPNLLRQDIEILTRLGANAVRSHYALPEMFLDFCDQYGLLFLSEVPAWQYGARQLQSGEIQDKILNHLNEMVARDMNHPSIVSWSLGNEWSEPDRSYDAIRSMMERARRVDPTRLLTFVTGGAHVWRVQELVDVICVNWARYQWYDPFTTLDRQEGETSVASLNRIHERYPDKPVILTELGGAEAEAGWHNWGNAKWSEEFQARNVEDSALYALEQDWISGGCVWQYCDTRSAPERFLAGRLHGWNGKGVLDAYRNPKLAFYRLQQVFHAQAAKPAVGITGLAISSQ
jgi:beta-glucuronidase